MSVRLQLVPNAVFICMRKNIDKTSPILSEESLLNGVDECFDLDDSRIVTKGKNYHIGCDSSYINEEISILDDTLGIDWRIEDKAILSDKDTKHPLLKDFDSPFDIKINLY